MNFLKSSIKLKQSIALLVCVCFIQFSNAQSEEDTDLVKETATESNFKYSAGVQLLVPQLKFDNKNIDNSARVGFGVDFGVSYQINEHFSLHSGLGLSYIKSKASIDTYSGAQNTRDIAGDTFEFRYQLQNFSENHKLTGINVPIAIQYETTGTLRFFAKAGFETTFFVRQSYTSKGNLNTTGFFPNINAVLDRPTFAGFGSFNNQEFSTEELDINNSYSAILELGGKKMFENGNAIYVGVFARLGLNTINSNSNNQLVLYNAQQPTQFIAPSVLNATNTSNNQLSETKINIFGINIRYEFSL